ncbi:MAG: hypothetical protein PHH77_04870 [Victivallaceae bacterium]|nr:hypothetical protein [Victivallaceae bacterium]
MLRRMLTLVFSGLIAVAVAGCTHQVIVAEVLQQPLGSKIYLNQNIWYEKPDRISCLNIQRGKILPFGTEVEPVTATDYKLSFKTGDGKKFTIDYDYALVMLPMEAYIRQVFTLKNRAELTKGMKPKEVKLLLQGKVGRGMTRAQVLLACGAPAACRTPSVLNSTWVYWTSPDSIYRVVFLRDRVNAIVNIDDKP